MYVVTIDQRRSRTGDDQVDALLEALATEVPGSALVLPFEATVGDEVQGVLRTPEEVVALAVRLAAGGRWSVGVGVGAVTEPLGPSARRSSGPAFVRARAGVDLAKRRPEHLAVAGVGQAADEVDALLRLLVAVVARRTEPGRAAVELAAAGHTQDEIARRLGITRQAVGQRLAAALWRQERDVLPLAVRLLTDASVAAESADADPRAG